MRWSEPWKRPYCTNKHTLPLAGEGAAGSRSSSLTFGTRGGSAQLSSHTLNKGPSEMAGREGLAHHQALTTARRTGTPHRARRCFINTGKL